jgi:DNA-binding protein H-NS
MKQLKSMSIGRLTSLREKVDAMLKSKVAQTRRDLESELAKLSRVGGPVARSLGLARRGGLVAPKYRNPENPSETWAGRGLKPRWLAAALKGGHKLEDFLIQGAKPPAAKKPKRRMAAARKSSKPRKAAAVRKAKATRKPSAPRRPPAPKMDEQPEAGA